MSITRKKLKEMSLNELLNLVKNYPYGSRHFKEITDIIVNHHNKKYKEQYILCTKGLYESGAIFRSTDAANISYKSIKENLNSIVPLEQFSPFYYCERNECEHNPLHRQIIVNTLVVDESYENAIVLQDGKGYVSLIGGHVDYDRNDNQRNITQILNFNMKKELREEVGNSGIIEKHLEKNPSFVLSSNGKKGNYYDMTHLIMLYVTVIPKDDFDKQVKNMTETEKYNTPVVLSFADIMEKTRKNSVRLAIEIARRNKSKLIKKEEAKASK